MDLDKLKQILKCSKITDINRISGLQYNVLYSPVSAKTEILKEECSRRYVKLCESKDEEIEAIINPTNFYNEEQKDLIDVLYSNNIIAIPLEPEIKEEPEFDDNCISEAARRIISLCNNCQNSDMSEDQIKDYISETVKKEILSIITKR